MGQMGGGWGKGPDTRDHNNGPDICWDQGGQIQPISLEEMTPIEREVSLSLRNYFLKYLTLLPQLFASDVNSPLKPPPQNLTKDQNPSGATNGRKTSVSHGQGNSATFGMSSPTSTRPGTRRRETSDTLPYSSLASPGGSGRFNRDEPSPFFVRKGTDSKDPFGAYGGEDDANAGPKTSSPFGGLMRSNTAGSALLNGPASPWGSTAAPLSATLSPMGNFGSFSVGGGTGQPAATTGEKRPGFGSVRGESRLAHLMPKESSEDLSKAGGDRSQDTSRPWRSRPRTDTDPFGDDPVQSGPGGGRDVASLLGRRAPGFDTPIRQVSGELGMAEVPGFRDSAQRREQAEHTPQGNHRPGLEHLSPTDTNPYGSPNVDPTDNDEADNRSVDDEAMYQPRGHGLGGIPEHAPNYGNLARGFPGGTFDGSDRSQTSSAGASKGFPSLGGGAGLSGLGNLGGWPTSANPIGTPDRERSGFQGAFGSSIFGPMGDMQSPGPGNLGGPFGTAAPSNISNTITAGRGSKLGSLFPAAMQLQMQAESEHPVESEQRQGTVFGAIGRNAFNGPPRDTDSPMRPGRGVFDSLLPSIEHRDQGISAAEMGQGQTSAAPYSQPPGLNYQQSQSPPESSANQMPQTQQRQMVMPDRMRWVYLDPQGQTQGPWSGLEMHDWYKASFFTADLSVKKVEDSEFEPLGQLIRRIGNSREPFLVPQIGVPHGPPSAQGAAPFAPVAAAAAPQPGSVQPPFAGSFPSFGTTLTAEQQNALERRKQEEQYLMARQREFLAQQQVSMKQMQMQGIPSALHHHSSAHSLQSQPSFGSITSPIGMPPQTQLPGVSSFFEGGRQPGAPGAGGLPSEYLREEEMARLNIQDRQQPFAGQGIPVSQPAQPQLNYQQQMELHALRAAEQARLADPQGFKARLREFELLRAQHEAEQQGINLPTAAHGEPIAPPHHRQAPEAFHEPADLSAEVDQSEDEEAEPLSLTQQIQKTASAKHSPAAQPESPWGKVQTGYPMPFPAPPQSTTPLPAPTAQRGRSNLPETLNLGTRSRSETPDLTSAPPSVAPWAKEQTETAKGPSLKEIQEAEAKKAAKLEEAHAAVRRAAMEQERLHQPVVPAPAPGLPSNSTWGSSASPATTTTPSAWAKPAPSKAITSGVTSAASKRTLADIQREEELRKQKLATVTAATALPGQASGGKRYADLASKTAAAGPPTASAWSTVGAGGKVKIPTGPAASLPSNRAVSNTIVPTTVGAKAVRPPVAARSATTGTSSAVQGVATTASQEFTKWAKDALAKGLNTGINGKFIISL